MRLFFYWFDSWLLSTLSQYLDRRELLSNPEEKSRLLLEVPEVIAEEPEPERVDVDVDIEDDFMEPNHAASIEPHYDEKQELKDSPEAVAEECVDVDVKVEDHSIETPKLRDEEDQPPWAASAGASHLL